MKINNILIIAAGVLIFSKSSYSQNTNEKSTLDTLNESTNSFMFNVSYTNNNLEYISGNTLKLPTLFANISFFSKWGLYTGIDYSKSFGDSINCYEYSLQAGYQKYFDNGFDVDLSYSWRNYTGDTLLEGINYDHSVDGSMAYEINKFYFSINGSYKIGKTKNLFAEIGLSRFIYLENIFSKEDLLMINPTVSATLGTDYWLYENMTLEEKLTTLTDLQSLGYKYENFSYEGISLYIPVSYGIKNIYLTASWMYRIPGGKFEYFWENQSSFMFSLTYFLNFNKK